MRNDGDVTVFQIEHKSEARWYGTSFDYFGTPHEAFSASGQCWQETGIHGTYDAEIAEIALMRISRTWPETAFRLVRRRYVRTTEVALELTARSRKLAPKMDSVEHSRRAQSLRVLRENDKSRKTA